MIQFIHLKKISILDYPMVGFDRNQEKKIAKQGELKIKLSDEYRFRKN